MPTSVTQRQVPLLLNDLRECLKGWCLFGMLEIQLQVRLFHCSLPMFCLWFSIQRLMPDVQSTEAGMPQLHKATSEWTTLSSWTSHACSRPNLCPVSVPGSVCRGVLLYLHVSDLMVEFAVFRRPKPALLVDTMEATASPDLSKEDSVPETVPPVITTISVDTSKPLVIPSFGRRHSKGKGEEVLT